MKPRDDGSCAVRQPTSSISQLVILGIELCQTSLTSSPPDQISIFSRKIWTVYLVFVEGALCLQCVLFLNRNRSRLMIQPNQGQKNCKWRRQRASGRMLRPHQRGFRQPPLYVGHLTRIMLIKQVWSSWRSAFEVVHTDWNNICQQPDTAVSPTPGLPLTNHQTITYHFIVSTWHASVEIRPGSIVGTYRPNPHTWLTQAKNHQQCGHGI